MTDPVEPGRTVSRGRRQLALVLVASALTAGLVTALVAEPSSPPLDFEARPDPRASAGVETRGDGNEGPSEERPAPHPDDTVLTTSLAWPVRQPGAGLTRDDDAITTVDRPPQGPPPDPTPAGESDRGTREAAAPATERRVYTWRDGDVTRRVWVEVEETAAQDGESALRDAVLPEGSPELVFYSESSGAPMTLPGGVLLVLDPEWTRDEVKSFFDRNEISGSDVSELGYLTNGFLVETASGLPSLNLANALARQQGVLLSSPNWLREVTTR